MTGLRGRHFLTLQDFSADELWEMLRLSRDLKDKLRRGVPHELLPGKILALMFQKPSTRTRVSFEVAMRHLGGSSLYLEWGQLQLGRGEPVSDTAKVLSRYVDGVAARVYGHEILEEMARHATIPIINALSDFLHPCQGLADLFTVWERWGRLEGLKVAYVGDGNNVCHSLMIGCSKLGVDISVASPEGYKPDKRVVDWARENAEESGSKVEILTDPVEAVKDANVIYTDVFVSMGMEREREERLRVFLPKYQVTLDLFRYAAEDAVFMHCLPAHRGEEVAPEVIDGERSIVFEQAENRLHTEKALLALLL